jgi:hypothetical protein
MLPWREDLAQIVERGAQQGTLEPPKAIGDFTIRFCALLDGLAIFHLRHMPSPATAWPNSPWTPPAPS